MPTEGTITKAVMALLRSVPSSFVMKIHGGGYQNAGFPDILFICNGITFAFEVKQPGCNATKLQRYVIDRLNFVGAVSCVVRSVEDVEAVLVDHGYKKEDGTWTKKVH